MLLLVVQSCRKVVHTSVDDGLILSVPQDRIFVSSHLLVAVLTAWRRRASSDYRLFFRQIDYQAGVSRLKCGLFLRLLLWIVANVDHQHLVADGARTKRVDRLPSTRRIEQAGTAARPAAQIAL